ncbi:hypothetical protein L1887_15158 [Cichorium endivia]|nr:hypothetical protein L1887_15158 [Cichorium endivia]
MPRSHRTGSPLALDKEIEKTARSLRKQATLCKKQPTSQTSTSHPTIENQATQVTSTETQSETTSPPSPTPIPTPITMAAPEQTLRQWATQDVTQQPLCITYPAMINFELKSGLIHLLPTFRGVENEDPHKFLKEFHVVCTGMKPHDVTENPIKLRAFPFAVQDSARDWLYYLPPGSVTTWNELARMFLDKYFPEMKASALRREIIGIKQQKREALHRLTAWDRRLLNASSGGSIADKTPTQIRELINTMAEDSKHTLQEEEWYPDPPRAVNEVNNPKLESQISELTKAVLMLTKEKATQPPVRPCGVCLQVGHPTDMCPLLQEETEEAKATGPFQRQYDQPQGNSGWNQGQSSNYPPRNLNNINPGRHRRISHTKLVHHQLPLNQAALGCLWKISSKA